MSESTCPYCQKPRAVAAPSQNYGYANQQAAQYPNAYNQTTGYPVQSSVANQGSVQYPTAYNQTTGYPVQSQVPNQYPANYYNTAAYPQGGQGYYAK